MVIWTSVVMPGCGPLPVVTHSLRARLMHGAVEGSHVFPTSRSGATAGSTGGRGMLVTKGSGQVGKGRA